MKEKLKKSNIIIISLLIIIVIGIFCYVTSVILQNKKNKEKNNKYNEAVSTGNYQIAYDLSDDLGKDKNELVKENLLAYLSKDIVNELKNRESFVLRDIWWNGNTIIIAFNGTNSYGGLVVNYMCYVGNIKNYNSQYLSSLDDEKIYSSDTSSKVFEKNMKNILRKNVKKMIQDDSYKVDDQIVNNINTLYRKNGLNNVKLLNEDIVSDVW